MKKRLEKILSEISGYSIEELKERETDAIIQPFDCLLAMKQALTLTDVGCSYFTSSDIGKEFEIVKNTTDHDFNIGETVVLECVSLAKDDEYKFRSERDYWWCSFTDVKML